MQKYNSSISYGMISMENGITQQPLLCKDYLAVAPKVATDSEAKSLIKNFFLNPDEFYLPFILPTTSKSEPAFNPNGFWRGPIWMSTNWIVFKGLKNYGFELEAKYLLNSSLKLLEKSGFREQYDPLTGKGYGAINFTWGGLIVDMLAS